MAGRNDAADTDDHAMPEFARQALPQPAALTGKHGAPQTRDGPSGITGTGFSARMRVRPARNAAISPSGVSRPSGKMHTNSPSRSDHVSFVDALVISAACRRPIRFIMDNAIFQAPVIRTLAKDDAAVYEQAFEAAGAAW